MLQGLPGDTRSSVWKPKVFTRFESARFVSPILCNSVTAAFACFLRSGVNSALPMCLKCKQVK